MFEGVLLGNYWEGNGEGEVEKCRKKVRGNKARREGIMGGIGKWMMKDF
jgi:hypothetical protein